MTLYHAIVIVLTLSELRWRTICASSSARGRHIAGRALCNRLGRRAPAGTGQFSNCCVAHNGTSGKWVRERDYRHGERGTPKCHRGWLPCSGARLARASPCTLAGHHTPRKAGSSRRRDHGRAGRIVVGRRSTRNANCGCLIWRASENEPEAGRRLGFFYLHPMRFMTEAAP